MRRGSAMHGGWRPRLAATTCLGDVWLVMSVQSFANHWTANHWLSYWLAIFAHETKQSGVVATFCCRINWGDKKRRVGWYRTDLQPRGWTVSSCPAAEPRRRT